MPKATAVSRYACHLALIILLAVWSSSAGAAIWSKTRDTAMSLREAGRYVEAYRTVAAFDSNSSATMHDRDFVAGWIALRFLNRPDIALDHFKDMAARSGSLSASGQDAGRAKAGYWIARALKQSGQATQAQAMFAAAGAYPTTFYGQLSRSELGQPITAADLARHASSYPVKNFYWYDQRASKQLVLAIIREESRFKQSANSSANARGMMQVLDGTARLVGREAGVNVDVSMMRKNADYNIAIGSRYLADQLSDFGGNAMLAAAAYNAGPQRAHEWIRRFGDPRGGRVDPVDWAESVPFKETRDYIQKVIASYVVYLALVK